LAANFKLLPGFVSTALWSNHNSGIWIPHTFDPLPSKSLIFTDSEQHPRDFCIRHRFDRRKRPPSFDKHLYLFTLYFQIFYYEFPSLTKTYAHRRILIRALQIVGSSGDRFLHGPC